MSSADDKMPVHLARALDSGRLDALMLDAASRGSSSGFSRWMALGAGLEARCDGLLASGLAAQAVCARPGRQTLACLELTLERLREKDARLGARGAAEALWQLAAGGRRSTASRLLRGQDWSALEPKDASFIFKRCLEKGEHRPELDEGALMLALALGASWTEAPSAQGCLHWAARAGNFNLAQELSRRGWDPDAANAQGEPAWVVAADTNQMGVAIELSSAADPRLHGGMDRWAQKKWRSFFGADLLMISLQQRIAQLEEAQLREAAQEGARSKRRQAL